MKKRLLALLLALSMMTEMVSVGTAAGIGDPEDPETEDQTVLVLDETEQSDEVFDEEGEVEEDTLELEATATSYDVDAAMAYAAANWNKNTNQLCAEFVSRCVKAGGLSGMTVQTGTGGCWRKITSLTGLSKVTIKLNSSGYATKALNGDNLRAGDVVVQWCTTHSIAPHIMICAGYDSSGYAVYYAHNGALNKQRYKLSVNTAYQHTTACDMGGQVIRLSTLDSSVNVVQNAHSFTYVDAGSNWASTLSSVTVNHGASLSVSNNFGTWREDQHPTGWTVKRDSDGKYYVAGQGWRTKNEISQNGWSPKLYTANTSYTIDNSWTNGSTTSNDSYTFYAQWQTHSWNGGVVTTQPTTTSEGVRTYTCADCRSTKTEAIAKLPETEIVEETAVWNGSALMDFAGGSGTLYDPYLISNGAQLAYLAELTKSDSSFSVTTGKYYELTRDINMGNQPWSGIRYFGGHFQGSGYAILNLNINLNEDYVGLFGTASENSEINILNVSGTVSGGLSWTGNTGVGGIVGYTKGKVYACENYATISSRYNTGGIAGNAVGAEISECSNYGAINAQQEGGGISGFNNGSTFENCLNVGAVTGKGSASLGGIIGESWGTTTISRCANLGQIAATDNEYSSHVGGIVGHGDSTSALTIENCYNAGEVKGDFVGGILGYHFTTQSNAAQVIRYCHNVGKITAQGEAEFAGPVYGAGKTQLSYVYYLDRADSADNKKGGTAVAESNYNNKASFPGFDFSNIWYLDSNDEYPWRFYAEGYLAQDMEAHVIPNVGTYYSSSRFPYYFGDPDGASTCHYDNNWEYVITDTGNAVILRYAGSETDLVIPSRLNGYPVAAIARSALRKTTYYGGGEEWTHSVTSVSIPSSVTYIGDYAFWQSDLKEIVIPDTVEYLGYAAFKDCASLVSVTLPDHITELGSWMFDGCTSLTQVNLPSSLREIGGYAFSDTALTDLTVPAGVNRIDDDAFAKMDALTEIAVDPANTAYVAEHGVLYTADGKTLVAYPGGKTQTEFTVPTQVNTIQGSAFYGNDHLKEVTLPAGLQLLDSYAFCDCTALERLVVPKDAQLGYVGIVEGCTALQEVRILSDITTIPESMFDGCTSLTDVYLPTSLTEIGPYAFYECTALRNVWFAGDEEQFAAITVMEDNDPFLQATIHYNVTYDGAISQRYSGEEEGFTWSLVNGVLTVSGTGVIDEHPWYDENLLELIDTIIIEEGITEIDTNVFAHCKNLTQITFPNSLTTIGRSAFSNCSNLRSVTLPGGLQTLEDSAFMNCDLQSVTIPASVTEVGGYPFGYNDNLTEIIVESGNTAVKSIDGVLFSADGTTLIQYPATRTDTSYTVPSTVTKIDTNAFGNSVHLTFVTLPEGLQTIESGAFYGCSGLRTMTIPASVSRIWEGPFEYCTALTAFTVADGNTNYRAVDGVLFDSNWDWLVAYPAGKADTTYTVPSWVDRIGASSFTGSVNLKQVIVEYGVSRVGSAAFTGCTALEEVILPESVTQVSSYAFNKCTALTNVRLPSELDALDWGMFSGCTALQQIDLPDSITEIPSSTFNSCTSLQEISIPEGVTSIGDHAFNNCRALQQVTIPAAVESIDYSVFSGCDSLLNIRVATGNNSYKDEDGVLFTADGATLVAYPAGRTDFTYQVPGTVTAINDDAFEYNQNLLGITIPESVTTLSWGSFYLCSNLTYVVLPKTMTEIEPYVFSDCENLQDVYYGGSEADFGNITIEKGNEFLTGAAVHYNSNGPSANAFTDVHDGDWFQNAVNWAVIRHVTAGYPDNTFGVSLTCTRAAIVQFLYNQAGKPAYSTTTSPFTDVKPGDWYYDAVLWAVENGITSGMGDGTFGVNNSCTREQAVTFIWNTQGQPQVQVAGSGFSDVSQGTWYYNAVVWAVQNQVTAGVGNGMFGVSSPCTRTAIVQFMYNLETNQQ